MTADDGSVTSWSDCTDSDRNAALLALFATSKAFACRFSTAPSGSPAGTLIVKVACASPAGGVICFASETENAPLPVSSMRVTAMASEAVAMIVTGRPGTMCELPFAVWSVIVGPVVSATGRITSAAVPTFPALSIAEACSVTWSPGFAVAGTRNVNDVTALVCVGWSVRESLTTTMSLVENVIVLMPPRS